ncbi:ABC transporter ATP-binding protein [Erysipelothrix larvae]|uniref:ABC transporter ATP-binding protein n=2 Tax=Erysipelothrix larvae TaxID=1514105 RepID=A0A0X8H205_9FIRM|nr:ABC transporter ATP-binding protein [Erysipelothrix larvae]
MLVKEEGGFSMVLQLENIQKKFGSFTALEDISFDIHQGEIFGFLGPSGSGKTTTIKIVTGQLAQTNGSATVLGKDTRRINEGIYEQIGIVTDTSGLYEKLSVYDNLKIFADILNVDQARIVILLKKVGLFDHKKKKAGKLSKGQRQRLVLARAILHKPKLLFLDEPTSGLDPTTAKQIQDMFLELKHEGMSIFLTTHNMEEATRLCDTIALLNEGRIVEQGSPQEICLRHNQDKQYRVTLNNREVMKLDDSNASAEFIYENLQNGQIETLHSCEPTLEDVFIKVTGRELL